jgi:hypothetical protein
MADSIGKLSVTLSADSKELDSAIDRVSAKLKHFAELAGKGIGAGLGALGNPFGAAAGGFNSILGGLAGAAGPIGAAATAASTAAAAFKGLLDMTERTGKAMLETTMEAKRFGLSPQEMQAMNMASRGHEEGLAHALRHQNQFLGEASQGGKPQIETLARLGLTPEMMEQSANPFAVIIDRLNKIPSATERAAESAKIFGKNWLEVADMISRGSKAIEEAGRVAQEKGLMPDPETVRVMKEWTIAWREMGQTAQGFLNRSVRDLGTPLMDYANEALKPPKHAAGFAAFNPLGMIGLLAGPELTPQQAATAERARRQGEGLDAKIKGREKTVKDALELAREAQREVEEAAQKQFALDQQEATRLAMGLQNPFERARTEMYNVRRLAPAFQALGIDPKLAEGRVAMQQAQAMIGAAGVREFDALRPANMAVERGTEAERSFNLEQDRMREQQESQKTIVQQLQEANRKLGQLVEKADREGQDLINVVSFPN